jgi:hypothetical protein
MSGELSFISFVTIVMIINFFGIAYYSAKDKEWQYNPDDGMEIFILSVVWPLWLFLGIVYAIGKTFQYVFVKPAQWFGRTWL